jgi:Beta-lactamase enzyme family
VIHYGHNDRVPSPRSPRWGVVAGVLSIVLGVALIGGYLVMNHRSSADAAAPQLTDDASSSAVASASPTGPDPAVAEQVRTTLAGQLSAKGKYAAVGVLDRVTGATVVYNETISFQTASIVKADILASLLWKLQNSGGHLSDSQKSLATLMITHSDNDAASDLYEQLGEAAGLNAANKAFGLTSTTPGPGSTWGKAHTTIKDQLTLLKVLTSDDSPLSAASRAYELDLMSRVASDQKWGVPAAAGPGATGVYVKNGWDTLAADGGLWEINSIGRVVEPGHDWLVVVLSSHNSSMSVGQQLVEKAAKTAVSGLRS